MSEVQVVKGGKPDFQKLVKQKRLKLDENGDPVGVPKNNVIGKNTKKIKMNGIVVKEIEIDVNGGHAKAVGSVWRAGLAGPKKYHLKKLLDKENRVRIGENYRPISPELEKEEFNEYQQYLKFLEETSQEIAENEDFYKWLKKARPSTK